MPMDPRRQVIFFAKNLDGSKITKLKDAVVHGATWRQAAMSAGIFPREFTYMMELGAAGHPVYGELTQQLMMLRAESMSELQASLYRRAVSGEDGSEKVAMKLLEVEERDSWVADNTKRSEVAVNVTGKVDVRVTTSWDDEVVEAEDAEVVE